MIILLRVTRSQQMAIVDVLMEHMRCPDHTEVFVDCSQSPPKETTIGELLQVFGDLTNAQEVR